MLKAASSLVINKSSNEMVAVCLISLWEELPLVSDIAVIPRYRSNRIASKLLRKALTVLNEEYEILRLFVTIGNSAEALYYNLGFYPGLEQTTFQLVHRSS
ncbi:GNAT family N-acetyltransferase [Paenibacillus mesophilus]|uniref:GNAT family N-acetyltransferase n=1 Tax=Paenibacillus mesophilus TaxID=2582849 RepID=UPI003B75BD60